MARQLSKSGVITGQTVEATHVSQSVDAFTGLASYDIQISGSLVITGSTILSGSTSLVGVIEIGRASCRERV